MIGLRFDYEGCAAAFLQGAKELVIELTEQLNAEATAKAPHPAIRASLHPDLKQEAQRIIGWVEATDWRSILYEWGTGTSMDRTNPGLMEYIMSDLWNPARPHEGGAPIVGRPPGEYRGVDGELHTSTGSRQGQNLEPYLGTTEATHFMARSVEAMRNRVWEAIAEYLQTFPYGRFLIGGGA